jgi:hypothetical protein
MRARKLFALAFCAAALVGASAGTAFAGEKKGPPLVDVPGQGTPPTTTPNYGQDTGAPEHANSICAFSGLNDGNPPISFAPTQSYGQDVVLGLTDVVPSPGEACGPGSNTERGTNP